MKLFTLRKASEYPCIKAHLEDGEEKRNIAKRSKRCSRRRRYQCGTQDKSHSWKPTTTGKLYQEEGNSHQYTLNSILDITFPIVRTFLAFDHHIVIFESISAVDGNVHSISFISAYVFWSYSIPVRSSVTMILYSWFRLLSFDHHAVIFREIRRWPIGMCITHICSFPIWGVVQYLPLPNMG